MALTTEEVKHIAKLSRLHLNDDEVEKYRNQLDSILTYVQQLQAVDTTGVPELQHALEVSNVFRDDVVEVCDPDVRNRALENFSNRQGDLLEVQAVFNRE
jgi:aspartyl-tRNA(Asn)/glutamyl-tRNA(Gln) amidotransferase subunit C